MIKIGIDYSLISPAVCIYKDGEYSFISFFDDYGKDWKGSKSKHSSITNNCQGLLNSIHIQGALRKMITEKNKEQK